jgi:hypothetical protein
VEHEKGKNHVSEVREGEGRVSKKKKRGRWSELTGSLAGVPQQLRVGELKCRQPGGEEIWERG